MMTPVAVIRRFPLALAVVACTAPAHAVVLNVVKAGDGSGRVQSTFPSGIDCGATCSFDFSASTVDLQATPQPGSTFVGW